MAIPETALASDLDTQRLNHRFEHTPAEQIVQWAAEQFGGDLVMTSSFGADSAALLHMASTALPGIRVIMVDTGFLFPETHLFMEQLRARLNLNVWSYRTRQDPFAYLKEAGETDPSWRADIDRCCATNKNEPMERAMRDLKPRAWLRGIRRSQSAARSERQFVEWANRYGCYAVSPLLSWTHNDVQLYLDEHALPRHPLWDKGYLSIGCNPLSCTRAVGAGEDARSGRWAQAGKTECGINLTDSIDSAKL